VLLDIRAMGDTSALALLDAARAAAVGQQGADSAAGDTVVDAPQPSRPGLALPLADVLGWLICVAARDNQLDAEEYAALEAVAAARGIPTRRLDGIMNAARAGQYHGPLPGDALEARQWLSSGAQAMIWDARLSRAERKLLMTVALHYGMSDYDVRLILKQAQVQSYRAARDQLRQARERAQAA
jgi:hypothetical protein